MANCMKMASLEDDKKHRGSIWSLSETALLIQVWSEEYIQKLFESGGARNLPIYQQISKILQEEHDVYRTPVQCRTKIKKLKEDFNKTEDKNRGKSGEKHHTCAFYEALAPILKDRPRCNPGNLLDSRKLPTKQQQENVTSLDSEDDEIQQVDPASLTKASTLTAPVDADSSPETEVTLPVISNKRKDRPSTSTTLDESGSSSSSISPTPFGHHHRGRKRNAKEADMSSDLQQALNSFKDISDAAMKSYNEGEDRRLERLLKMENDRQKAAMKQEKMMLTFFSNMFGQGLPVFFPPNSDDDGDSSVSDVLGQTNSVLFG